MNFRSRGGVLPVRCWEKVGAGIRANPPEAAKRHREVADQKKSKADFGELSRAAAWLPQSKR
jgi:hypothetical protein